MRFANRSVKWAVIISVLAVILVAAGYFAAVIARENIEDGKTQAANAFGEEGPDEGEGMIPEDIKKEILSEADSQSINDEIKETGLTTAGKCSAELVDDGSVNLLIIGEDKASHLYDTIGIVSISKEKRILKFIMIPRDTYIEYNDNILDALDGAGLLKAPGIFKINYTHHIGTLIKYDGRYTYSSISFLADVIGEKFGIAVDDFVKVNTEGFVELVDHFGGVEINVPYNMDYDDPYQDLSIHLDKGIQLLDGKQSEGFVRFREGLREDGTSIKIGDTGRKKNQIDFLKAFVKQHGTITKIDKLPEMFNILNKNIKSSIGLGDVLSKYIGIARDIIVDKYEIESMNLEGGPRNINGSSYVDIR